MGKEPGEKSEEAPRDRVPGIDPRFVAASQGLTDGVADVAESAASNAGELSAAALTSSGSNNNSSAFHGGGI